MSPASTARVVSTPDWAAVSVGGSLFMAEYTAHYNVLHTDRRMREKISDLDDSHPEILGAKLIHLRSSIARQDKWDIWIQLYKTQWQHTNCQTNTDHEDGIVSGNTMNVYIPLYAPESDMNAFIKPSVISTQPLVWKYSTVHCIAHPVCYNKPPRILYYRI